MRIRAVLGRAALYAGLGILATSCATEPGETLQADADIVATEIRLHLLLSEVALARDGHEFIEIYNPTNEKVDLSNYYLSDDADYARLPGAHGAGPAPAIEDKYDFIVKFPDGATIEPGGVRVVALRYRDFMSVYRQAPDFGILQTSGATAMVPIIVDTAGGDPQLNNTGEAMILFHWNGASDLVADVDMVTAGQALETYNRLRSKTLLNIDGPDEDDRGTTYRPDAFRIGVMTTSAKEGFSHKRIHAEREHESHNRGGNGIYGDDETTEDLSSTWDDGEALTEATPGVAHPGLEAGWR